MVVCSRVHPVNIPRSPLAAGHCPVEVSEWPPLTGCGVSSEHTDRVLSLEESCWEGSRGSCASRGQEQCSQTSLVPRPSPGGRAPGSWRLQSAQGVRKCGSGWGTGSEPAQSWVGLAWAPALSLSVCSGAVGAALWPSAAWVEWSLPVDGPVCPLVGFVLVLRRVQAEAGGLGWS